MGEERGEGKTTAPISDDPKTQGRLKSPANSNLVSGNRLKEYNGIEYTYDALGNLIYRQLPDGENQYDQYDLENQLVRAEIKKPAGNTEIWEYAYDPFGRRLSKERKDKLAWTSTVPKRTHFVWDGTRLLQEYTYKGSYTYIYTDQDSYEPLAQVFDNAKDGKQYLAYFHTDQVGIPREMTDIHGNLLWYGEYTAWGRLKKDGRVYRNAHQPFRLQNQYYDEETGLHYNLMRYYEPEAGRFVNQDPIGLAGGEHLYGFAPNALAWVDPLGLYGYYELYKNGKLVYRGITERKVIERIMEHAADCKDFDDVRYIENLKNYRAARDMEGSGLWHDWKDGNRDMLNKKRKIVKGYYHSYHKDKFTNNKDKDGRTFLTKKQISDRMKNANSLTQSEKNRVKKKLGKCPKQNCK